MKVWNKASYISLLTRSRYEALGTVAIVGGLDSNKSLFSDRILAFEEEVFTVPPYLYRNFNLSLS